ncbi:MAG: hypothetical protein NT109_07095 [Flavobacteriia bacterium]|nr:hypothetical protein [Flavobacteriia bacterium]
MISTYIYLISVLALLIIIGLKLRSAGKELENKNLTQAGTMWLIFNGAAILFALIMIITTLLKGSEICNCSDAYLAYTNEALAAKGDPKKIQVIQNKYRSDIEMCEKVFAGKNGDQNAVQKELEKCSSYKKLQKMQN